MSKSYDNLQPDPWIARVKSRKPPPCDCPCHHYRGIKHAACCPNAGRRYVAAGDYYEPYEETS